MSAYPIVYIRGYAMSSGEVEDTFNRPYYGFNLGSAKIRVTSEARPAMQIFESPVVRLLKEEGYVDSFNRFVDSRNEPIPDSAAGVDWRRTLWIFRFYDRESQILGEDRGEIEDYAEALALFLHRVRRACGDPDGFKVNLVAHSMGGLVARCYLQNKDLFDRSALRRVKAVPANKLFTYGTPHKGITFRRGLGWVEDVRDLFGVRGADTFGEKRMREFLSLGKNDPLHTLRAARGDLEPERVFCVIGTNYHDYTVWVSKKSVGPGSDGLVAIENAYVKGASRAFIHRAHSGPFGMVNSEEGFQNLTRFLFGDVRVELALEPLEVTQDLPGLQKDDSLEHLVLDVDISIRGLPMYIQTRRETTQSSIVVPMAGRRGRKGQYQQKEAKPVHLFTGFLSGGRIMSGDHTMRAALQLRIEPHYTHKGWLRESRIEGEAMLNERLHLGVERGARGAVLTHSWGPKATLRKIAAKKGGSYLIPFHAAASRFLKSKGVRVTLKPWN
jgi:pimeloyl-ACP methyl ester carboxylesterase